jgi:hypothetical protein
LLLWVVIRFVGGPSGRIVKQTEILRQEQAKFAADKAKQQTEFRKQKEELARQEDEINAKQKNLQGQASSPRKRREVSKNTTSRHVAVPSAKPTHETSGIRVTQPMTVNFTGGGCEGDENKTLDYSVEIDARTIVIPLEEGCFGPLVMLPNHRSINWQFYGATPEAGWISFLEPRTGEATEALGLSADPGKALWNYGLKGLSASGGRLGNSFRLQGHGVVRFVFFD